MLAVAGIGLFLAGGLALVLYLLFRTSADPNPVGKDPVADGGPSETPKPRAIDPRLKIVQPAIDKGVAFLRETLKKKESWSLAAHIGPGEVRYGMDGLIGLTLLECGVAADDPDILAIADELRKGIPALGKTYVISATLFFLNRWNLARPLDEVDRKLARSLGLRLCAGQLDRGVWIYDCPVLSPKQEGELLEKLEEGSPPTGAPGGYSISNSQFAMLALWGARKHGIPVRATLLRTAAHFHRTQFPDGHWIYSELDGPLYSSATCAGLMALAMEKALREHREFSTPATKDKETDKRADVAKAFEYVGRSIGRKKGDPDGGAHGYVGTIFQADAWGDLYYLWTIERLGMIYGLDKIEGKDWYNWGYPILLEKQKKDGSWQDTFQPEVDTCFALLFLRRANIAQDLADQLQELRGRTRSGSEAKD